MNEIIGKAVSWLLIAMVVLTSGIVLARSLGAGAIVFQELVTYMHATVLMLGAAFCLRHDEHVRVDVIHRGLSARAQSWIDFLGVAFLLLPLAAFLVFSSIDYVAAAWRIREGSREAGGLDAVYLLKTLIPITGGLLLWEALLVGWRSVQRIRRPAESQQS